ncbi:Dehydrogenase and Transketolase domain containing protein [Aphelenchoides besseyi]|nr:Dehydrogenase and Transketolase domain containing protein [Aphelenchoides besseyi]
MLRRVIQIRQLPTNLIRARNASTTTKRPQAMAPKNSALTAEPFLNGSSGVYVEQMYESWRRDPSSVHASWAAYFNNVESGARPGQAFQDPPTLTTIPRPAYQPQTSTQLVPRDDVSDVIHDHLKIQLLIRSYQTRGHNIADLDPLGINSADLDDTIPRELEMDFYGFTEKDLDREFLLPPTTFIGGEKTALTLREILHQYLLQSHWS